MKNKRLFDALIGMFAYDTGSIDIGIKDEVLREEVKKYLGSIDETTFRLLLSECVREAFLTSEALNKGYGIEDVASFLRWLDNFMDISI